MTEGKAGGIGDFLEKRSQFNLFGVPMRSDFYLGPRHNSPNKEDSASDQSDDPDDAARIREKSHEVMLTKGAVTKADKM